MIRPEDYISFIRREYLADFIRQGGATVKFVVPQDGWAMAPVSASFREAAEAEGFFYVRIDAAAVKIHMIDKVFHAIAREVDWDGLARTLAHRVLEEHSFHLPPDRPDPTLAEIAAAAGYEVSELRRELNGALQKRLLNDYRMAQEFRIAMLRLCMVQADDGDAARAGAQHIKEWLTGDLSRIAALKPDLIFQKIGRQNARHMLFSLAWFLSQVGYSGLVLDLDARQCLIARRSDVLPGSIHYSRPATLDTYEVLRQLIDATDELRSCFVMVTCAPAFLTDHARGVEAYHALKMRIWDDVHDAHRPNPFSALIRLSPDAGPLPGIV